ncbi:hypothetical protein EIN_173550 [Entamoeba invadens IP1]|uniref:PRA1 family protein n=1 Tax=Entamoeba invadens IP1 TaxID=370355 RepID=A0A0A1TYN8_ENTIV|nr:hypothetical protein EIN_173550 [Entamoeba invadens IP1]ELP84680.1 hypothetical protein EIN_173550 [Entamoeba invadens IP1]|eukprot:XP_004184026.1 hypothetical protein EIN_173550 [Entamoeba invadens IP1]
MSETVPLTGAKDNEPTNIKDVPAIEMEDVPLMDNRGMHGMTQLEWGLFWGFSVDYEFKFSGVMQRVKYNIDTFKINYIVLFFIMFLSSFLVSGVLGAIHLLVSLIFILVFLNHKSPVAFMCLKFSPFVILAIYFTIYFIFTILSGKWAMWVIYTIDLLVCIGHMFLKTSTLELVDDLEFDFN